MKKIMTAMNNPNLNKELKSENNIELICKDIYERLDYGTKDNKQEN